MITFHFRSVQLIIITQKPVIDSNRLRLSHICMALSKCSQGTTTEQLTSLMVP